MTQRSVLAGATMALALLAGQAARAECKLELLATIPITFLNNQPMVEATINGKPAHLRFSTGPETVFFGSALKDYGLRKAGGYEWGTVFGIGGTANADMTVIHELKTPLSSPKDGRYYIYSNSINTGEAGVFGEKTLMENDLEIDFPHKVVRVFNPKNCNGGDVVYWGNNYSALTIEPSGFFQVKLAGKTLSGSIGVGNEVSFVTLGAARSAGLTLKAAGPLPMGMIAGAVIKPVEVSIAKFPELRIGNETANDVPLAVGDLYTTWGPRKSDVVLGADFAMSHRIYFSRRQAKVYISYVGGAMFEDIYARLGVQAPPDARQSPRP